jgi:hypothetical protein
VAKKLKSLTAEQEECVKNVLIANAKVHYSIVEDCACPLCLAYVSAYNTATKMIEGNKD